MHRPILGVMAGCMAWLLAWFGSEKLFSVLWPRGYWTPFLRCRFV